MRLCAPLTRSAQKLSALCEVGPGSDDGPAPGEGGAAWHLRSASGIRLAASASRLAMTQNWAAMPGAARPADAWPGPGMAWLTAPLPGAV